MKLNKIVALSSLAAVVASSSLFAGTKSFKETVIKEEAKPAWTGSLSTGWDSLYMFRGVNVLRSNDKDYGDGIYWTGASLSYNLTANDVLTVGTWNGFSLGNDSSDKEFDLLVNYVHTIDNLSLGLGYTFYNTWGQVSGVNYAKYQNELNTSIAYAFDLGFMKLTPSATYYFNLGPDNDYGNGANSTNGAVDATSSFLTLRVDGNIPVNANVSLAPYLAYNFNFSVNTKDINAAANDVSTDNFNGANNFEYGLAIPVKINNTVTVSGYVAQSIATENLGGLTRQCSSWGGAKVTFSF